MISNAQKKHTQKTIINILEIEMDCCFTSHTVPVDHKSFTFKFVHSISIQDLYNFYHYSHSIHDGKYNTHSIDDRIIRDIFKFSKRIEPYNNDNDCRQFRVIGFEVCSDNEGIITEETVRLIENVCCSKQVCEYYITHNTDYSLRGFVIYDSHYIKYDNYWVKQKIVDIIIGEYESTIEKNKSFYINMTRAIITIWSVIILGIMYFIF